jgi:hypothetical protein
MDQIFLISAGKNSWKYKYTCEKSQRGVKTVRGFERRNRLNKVNQVTIGDI